jgi:Fis family transcriptional regulator, factor for inversion stimulation protein
MAVYPVELDVLVRRMIDGYILYGEAVTEFKRAFIQNALRENRGNKTRTARVLRMHRNTLSRTVAELAIKVDRRPPQKAAEEGRLIARVG